MYARFAVLSDSAFRSISPFKPGGAMSRGTKAPTNSGKEKEATMGGGSTVVKRYGGTIYDQQDMVMLGKKQVLRRRFKFSSMLGFASTVMVAWEFLLLVAPFALTNGGTPAVFWGIILSPVVMLPVYASLAEVASMSPTAGGKHEVVIFLDFTDTLT